MALAVAALLCASGPVAPAPAKAAPSPDYVPGEIVVGYAASTGTAHTADSLRATAGTAALESVRIVRVPRGRSIWPAIARLRRRRGVLYAVPNYIAHQAGGWIPNDPGNTHQRKGWRKLQWNFLPEAGIDAPAAWSHMLRVHRPGGKGVTVAVLDTGVAYTDWQRFREAPDFTNTRFVDPYDFVANNPYPLDREGHGTFVTGMIAESTNNGFGLTGLAYGATIMPVRVLDADGNGDSVTIGKGIRYAVTHGARVINLSLEFRKDVTASDIPEVIRAIGFAHRHGVVVIAAAGNDSSPHVAYPAAARSVISVGATTRDRCLADYSNGGPNLDLVAPGGGDDASLSDDPDCHPFRTLPPVRQMTFQDLNSLAPGANANRFGFPGTYGTSMAAPAVSATAALVIASGVIGRHPSPDAILSRLEQTATPLGGAARPNDEYGWGLVNAGAATAPGPPKPQGA
ncbi:MAG: S8 family serine peptidase [Solirubrobacteraceae bacterium]